VLTLSPPLYIHDPLFAQPWYANAGNFPGILIDPVFYDRAKSIGLLEGGGLQSLVKKHYFKTLLLTADDELAKVAKQSGYTQVTIPPDHAYYQSCIFPWKEGPLLMFIRSQGNQHLPD